ncbi:hypothetical protein P691DRAFT_808043 [Macrolepiota fuliginosa MF-IS2]|uniref:BTB domain-containing protein n=1 Tax=Macrolepiota fuliginosa MF-IS2 TaxID=1400762 RepID=A0A9P5X6B3_9AGAR|nr:hypothetical protein P691DRAFT_808043 [Macrolepiota fuliginosa MF-IS2]
MDPSRSPASHLGNYPIPDADTTSVLSLGLQGNFLSYPSPITPPAEFLFQQQYPGQMPTPTSSHRTSSMVSDNPPNTENAMISVSTAFHPGAHAVDPDTIFSSSDMVLFYVHSQVLRSVSRDAFRRVFEAHCTSNNTAAIDEAVQSNHPDGIIHVSETSSVLNIILHMLYGTPVAQHSPSFETLVTAVDRMPYYDLNPKDYIVPRTPLYDLLLTSAPLFPLQVYALAGHHDLQDLAVVTSSHLLSYPLANLPEEQAERMGAVYLKRLLCLHLDRFNALKQILLQPPHPHPPTKECSFTDQKKLTRAWALVAAYLAWDARPGTSSLWFPGHRPPSPPLLLFFSFYF